jgi:hypothetical protein
MKQLTGKALIRLLKGHGWRVLRVHGSHHVLGKKGSEVRSIACAGTWKQAARGVDETSPGRARSAVVRRRNGQERHLRMADLRTAG